MAYTLDTICAARAAAATTAAMKNCRLYICNAKLPSKTLLLSFRVVCVWFAHIFRYIHDSHTYFVCVIVFNFIVSPIFCICIIIFAYVFSTYRILRPFAFHVEWALGISPSFSGCCHCNHNIARLHNYFGCYSTLLHAIEYFVIFTNRTIVGRVCVACLYIFPISRSIARLAFLCMLQSCLQFVYPLTGAHCHPIIIINVGPQT